MKLATLSKLLFIPTFLSVISACTAGVSGYTHTDDVFFELSVDADINSHIEVVHEERTEAPSLKQFDMIDTNETNSELEGKHLALNAYTNLGFFEIFWNIHSRDDYIIELRVNDVPYINGSQLISSEYCSAFDNCYDEQYQFCDVSSDLTLSCETPNGSIQSANIDYMIHSRHQDIYMILQTCDPDYYYCEYQTLEVEIE